MASYTIIGGDQKQYGPVASDDVRQWIAEGRLDKNSLMKGEGDAEFRALEQFPEFADVLAARTASSETAPGSAGSTGWQERDYELDIGGCIARGWGVVKGNFGILFATLLLVFVVSFVFFGVLGAVMAVAMPKQLLSVPAFKLGFNYFISAFAAVIMGPLLGGTYLVFIKAIRGQSPGVGDVFAGFQRSFLDLFLGYLIVVLVTGLCMAPFNYTQAARLEPVLTQMQQHANPAELQDSASQLMATFSSILPILLVCLIPVTYVSVNWMFVQSLIIDKQMDFRTALKWSWKRVHKHWLHVFGLIVVTGLLNVAGALLCCIGLIFTVPIGFAALMVAYETIFSEKPSA